jgi:NAD(P)-dependent dehydrogenase (short-subunit alcohol dehydrogenase family)
MRIPPASKVALVTGANAGIGRVTARELVARGWRVFIACRSAQRAQPALDELRLAIGAGSGAVELLELDLADFESIRRCAQAFLTRDLPLHLLVNNAGVAGARGTTRSGFELAFGVNHVGPFLLTQLLLGRITSSAPARIVTVASAAHYRAPGIDWDAVRQPSASRTGQPEYRVSKLANVLFSAELARRTDGSGVTTYALHPGVVATEIWRGVPWPLRPLLKLAMLSPL